MAMMCKSCFQKYIPSFINQFYCLKMLNYLQIQSFETELPVPHIAAKEGGPPTFRGVFIRAPAILEVGPEVEVLADFTVQSNKAADPNYALESQEEVCYKFYFSVNCMTCNILTRAS